MKALLCKQFGPPESLVLEEVPSPQAGPGEVVVTDGAFLLKTELMKGSIGAGCCAVEPDA